LGCRFRRSSFVNKIQDCEEDKYDTCDGTNNWPGYPSV
jgi:hypothetical protein